MCLSVFVASRYTYICSIFIKIEYNNRFSQCGIFKFKAIL